MKCYMHPDVDSVDTCTICKKPVCAECKIDYDGKITCKPCALYTVNFLAGMIYGGCDSGPTIGDNVNLVKNLTPGGRLIASLNNNVKVRIKKANLTHQEEEIRKYILKSIVKEGKPPSNAEIMKELKMNSISDIESAIKKLYDSDIISIYDNRIISAYPFSVAKTNHRVIFDDGREIYALCAIDALGIHSMLGRDTTIISRCIECNKELTIVIKDGRIVSAVPENMVVYVNIIKKCGSMANTGCPHINFFCSNDDLCQWTWVNPEFENGVAYSLDDALECGVYIFGDMLK